MRQRQFVLVCAFLLAGVLRLLTGAIPTQAAGAVTLNPTAGAPGASITVVGTGFHASWHYNFFWDATGTPPAGGATADAGGGFYSTVTGPSSAGSHLLIVAQNNGVIVATASYQVRVAPTATPSSTATPRPTDTPSATATPLPQGPNPSDPTEYCTGLLGWCPDLSGLWTALTNAVFGAITDWMGGVWDAVTSPFTAVLITTPDLATDPAWHDVTVLETTLQPMAGTMFVCFLVLGMLAQYLSAMGQGNFTTLTTPLMRAIIVTGFIAGYVPIMDQAFQLLQGFAAVIASAPVLGTGSGFSAIGSAFAALSNVFSVTTLIDLLIVIVGVIVAIIAVVIRELGLGILALCYALGPLMIIAWLSPQFEFIARWWFRTFINVSLWPIGYALVLKLTGALLADSGWTGLTQSLAALGCVFLLYRIPGIIGSMCGSDVTTKAITAIVGTAIFAGSRFIQQAMGAVAGKTN